MDVVAQALADAIQQGTQLAGPVAAGYFAMRAAEALAAPLGFVATTWIVCRCILRCWQMDIDAPKQPALKVETGAGAQTVITTHG